MAFAEPDYHEREAVAAITSARKISIKRKVLPIQYQGMLAKLRSIKLHRAREYMSRGGRSNI